MKTNCLKIWWHKWKRLAQRIGNIQARIILTILYFLILPPFAFVYKIFGGYNPIKRDTYWIDKEKKEQTIENIKREW